MTLNAQSEYDASKLKKNKNKKKLNIRYNAYANELGTFLT